MIVGKEIEGLETVKMILDQLDDFEGSYEEFHSISEATQPNIFVQPVVEQPREQKKEQIMIDLKAEARSFVEEHEEFKADVQYQKTKAEWSHVESQEEDVQKAIVDNISIKLVFEVMMEKHARLDRTEFRLKEGQIPSMEEQHKKIYESLMNDMIASMKVIEEKKRIIEALD